MVNWAMRLNWEKERELTYLREERGLHLKKWITLSSARLALRTLQISMAQLSRCSIYSGKGGSINGRLTMASMVCSTCQTVLSWLF